LSAQSSTNDVVHVSSIDKNLQAPTRIAIDYQDNIYVTDHSQKCIVKYDAGGGYLETINTGFEPISIAVNSNNQLFVGTKTGGGIYKIENNGNISLFYSASLMPSSMTFSPDGLLYVVDSELKNMIALNVSAKVVKTIGVGNLIFPSSIAYDSRNERIFIGEHGGIGSGFSPTCKVWIYDLNGNPLGSFGSNGSADGQFYRIQGIAIGKCGNIYVNDPFQAKISVFDQNLNFLTSFGTFGNQPGELDVPLDILFNSQEKILVSSMNTSSVEIFDVIDILPTSNIANSNATICSGNTTDIEINFTGNAPWDFTYAVDGVNQTPISTSDNPYILTVAASGIYEVTALSDVNNAGTCFTGSATINGSNILPSSNISIENLEICIGETATIPVDFTGTSPWTFTYTIDGLNPTTITTAENPYIINIFDEGFYEITDISDAGCIGSPTGTTNVIKNAIPTANIYGSNLVLCEGETTNLTIELTGKPPFTFTYTLNGLNPIIISTLNTTYSIPVSEAGTYNVTSIMDVACTNATEQGSVELVVNTLPTAIMENVTAEIGIGEFAPIPVTFTGAPPWTLIYAIDNSSFITITDIYNNPYIILAGQVGNYTIDEVSDSNCIGEFTSGSATISDIALSVSEEKENPNNFVKLFPNPSTGIVNLKFLKTTNSKVNVDIISIIGQNVYSKQIQDTNIIEQIDLTSYANGIYIVRIASIEFVKTTKLILNK